MSFENYLRSLQNLGTTVEGIGAERQKRLDIERRGRAIAEAMRIGSGPQLAFSTGPSREEEIPYQQPVYAPGQIAGRIAPPPSQVPAGQDAIAALSPGMRDYAGRTTVPQIEFPAPATTRQTIPGQRIAAPIDRRAQIADLIRSYPESAAEIFTASQNEETLLQKQKEEYRKHGFPRDNYGTTPEEREYLEINEGQPAKLRYLNELEKDKLQMEDLGNKAALSKINAAIANIKGSPYRVTREDQENLGIRAETVITTEQYVDAARKARDRSLEFEEKKVVATIGDKKRKQGFYPSGTRVVTPEGLAQPIFNKETGEVSTQPVIDPTTGKQVKANLATMNKKKFDEITGEISPQVQQLADLVREFKTEYAGGAWGTGFGGKASLWLNKRYGDKEAYNWQERFNLLDNLRRHELFGATLTSGERQAWEASTVDANSSPDVVKKSLEARLGISMKVIDRLQKEYGGQGFDMEFIDNIKRDIASTVGDDKFNATFGIKSAPPQDGKAGAQPQAVIPSEEDLRHTAQKYKMTVEEVKAKLGIK